jgi:hypothetical protein
VSAPTTSRLGRPLKIGGRAPAFAYIAGKLNEHVARFGVERVAEVLRVAVADLKPMLEGRVAPPAHKLQRLRALARELEGQPACLTAEIGT